MTEFKGTLVSKPNNVLEYTLSDSERHAILIHGDSFGNNFGGVLSVHPENTVKYTPTPNEFSEMISRGELYSIKGLVENGYDMNRFPGRPIPGTVSLCNIAFHEKQFDIFKYFLDHTDQCYLNFISSEIAIHDGSIAYLQLILDRLGLFSGDVLKYCRPCEDLFSIKDRLQFMGNNGADLSYLFTVFSSPLDIAILIESGADVDKKIITLNSKFIYGSVDEVVSMAEFYSKGYEYASKFHPLLDYSEWNDCRFMVESVSQ